MEFQVGEVLQVKSAKHDNSTLFPSLSNSVKHLQFVQ